MMNKKQLSVENCNLSIVNILTASYTDLSSSTICIKLNAYLLPIYLYNMHTADLLYRVYNNFKRKSLVYVCV